MNSDFKIIETLKVENGEMFFAKEHFVRMKNAAKELNFKFNKEILKYQPTQDGMLRILLSKDGSFETQYKPLKKSKTNVIKISPVAVDSTELLLKYKTTYKPWYEKSYEKMRNGEIYDEVFFNEKGELTEGARTNIILEQDGKFFTPPVECGLLNGVLRETLLKSEKIIEKKLYLNDLKYAEKIYCINSVRGIVEVQHETSKCEGQN